VDLKDGVATQSFLQVLMRHPDQEKHWQTEPPRVGAPPTGGAPWRSGSPTWTTAPAICWHGHRQPPVAAPPGPGHRRHAERFRLAGRSAVAPGAARLPRAQLIDNGWRLKPIHKLIMTSAVYTQSGEVNPKNVKLDSDNRYFWHTRGNGCKRS